MERSPLEMATLMKFVSVWVNVIFAFGTTAPVGSVTVPERLAVLSWACTPAAAKAAASSANSAQRLNCMAIIKWLSLSFLGAALCRSELPLLNRLRDVMAFFLTKSCRLTFSIVALKAAPDPSGSTMRLPGLIKNLFESMKWPKFKYAPGAGIYRFPGVPPSSQARPSCRTRRRAPERASCRWTVPRADAAE